MSLFTKTVVVGGGVSLRDVEEICRVIQIIGERLRGLNEEVSALREEIAAMKREPRTSLSQRIRARGNT